MKTIIGLARIGCIWVAMNVYTTTTRLTKDMIQAIDIHVSMNESMRKDTERIPKGHSRAIANRYEDGATIDVEIKNCPASVDILTKLLLNPSKPFNNIISKTFQIHESSSMAQDFSIQIAMEPYKAYFVRKHAICYFPPLNYKVKGLIKGVSTNKEYLFKIDIKRKYMNSRTTRNLHTICIWYADYNDSFSCNEFRLSLFSKL